MILARLEIDFRSPVELGETIEIAVTPTRVGTKSFDLEYVLRAGERVVAEAKTVLVAYDYAAARSVEIPDEWKERLGRLMPAFERTTLDNGLRLLTASMPQVASTTASSSSPPARATRRRRRTGSRTSPSTCSSRERSGGRPRATSAARSTGSAASSTRSPARSTPATTSSARPSTAAIALDVLTDMLRHSKFEAEEIEREKGVIVEEMNMYFDTPRDFIGGVYEQLLFGDQPLGWDIIGRKETVRAATRETFFDYLSRWYQPSRMVVGIGGRLDGDVRAEVERLFGDLEPAETAAGAAAAAAAERRRPAREGCHEAVRPGAHRPRRAEQPLDHPDRYILQVLATVLGGGMSSRLFTEVRERRGLAYYVYGVNHSYTDAGSLYAQAGVDINRIDEAVTTIVDELKRIVDEPVPAEELDKAKNFAKGRFVLQLENPQGLILFGLRREVLEGGAVEPDEVLRGIDAVTAEDVQRVAQEMHRLERAAARGDRAVRRRRAVREAARRLTARSREPLVAQDPVDLVVEVLAPLQRVGAAPSLVRHADLLQHAPRCRVRGCSGQREDAVQVERLECVTKDPARAASVA